MQREIRGKHPFSIQAGQGITVFRSAAAFTSLAQQRRIDLGQRATHFGIDGLDVALGKNLHRGDMVIVEGHVGSYRLAIGVAFCCAKRELAGLRRCKSLIVTTRRNLHAIEDMVAKATASNERRSQDDVIIENVPSGYVQPGQILTALEDTLRKWHARNAEIDRVFVDGLGDSPDVYPFIRQEKTFGHALAAFLKQHSWTSLVTIPLAGDFEQDPILTALRYQADCILRATKHGLPGHRRVSLEIMRAHGSELPSKALLPLVFERGSLHVEELSPTFRLGEDGNLTSVPLHIYRQENSSLDEYWEKTGAILSAALDTRTQISLTSHLKSAEKYREGWGVKKEQLQIVELYDYELGRKGKRRKDDIALAGLWQKKQSSPDKLIGHLEALCTSGAWYLPHPSSVIFLGCCGMPRSFRIRNFLLGDRC